MRDVYRRRRRRLCQCQSVHGGRVKVARLAGEVMDPKTAVTATAVHFTTADLSQILLLLLSLKPFLQRHNLNALSYTARTNIQREPYSAAAVTLPFENLSRIVNELNTSILCYITYRTTCDGVP